MDANELGVLQFFILCDFSDNPIEKHAHSDSCEGADYEEQGRFKSQGLTSQPFR